MPVDPAKVVEARRKVRLIHDQSAFFQSREKRRPSVKAKAVEFPEIASAICEIRKTKDGLSIKMHDKRAALVDLGRYLGMFVDKTEVTGKDGGAVKFETVTDDDRVAALARFMARTGAALLPKATEH